MNEDVGGERNNNSNNNKENEGMQRSAADRRMNMDEREVAEADGHSSPLIG